MDPESRALFANAFEELKELQAGLSHMMDQFASLRDVLKEAPPEVAKRFDERLEYWQGQSAPLRAKTAAVFDRIIYGLKR